MTSPADGKAIVESGKYAPKPARAAAVNGQAEPVEDIEDTRERVRVLRARELSAATGQPVDEPDEPDEPDDQDPSRYGSGDLGQDLGQDPPRSIYADRILTRSAIRNLPDPAPLIDNVLDQGTTALLYGSRGTLKTFIALDWAASVATGRRWQGRDTAQRRTLYVVGEGAFGFKGRLDAWEIGWQRQIADGELDTMPFPVNLTNRVEVDNLRVLIQSNGYGFVILDTLARCMVGADENSAKDGGLVVDSMTRLLQSTPGGRGVVLGVHHAGKDGKTLRGSSAFEAGADTVYFTSKDGQLITLDREKRKDGPELDRHMLKLDLIDGTRSGVLNVDRSRGQTDSADRLLSVFMSVFSRTGATKAELRNVADMAPATFYRAVSKLVESGQLVNSGTDKQPFYKLSGE